MTEVTYGETQEEEMRLASEQERQPICVYCEKSLDEVRQTQYEYISWKWNPKTKEYEKSDSSTDYVNGDADPAYHADKANKCNARDHDFVDENLIGY